MGVYEENNSTEQVSFLTDMWSLLRSWVFMMFAVSNFLTSLGYPIPYTFVPVTFWYSFIENLRQLRVDWNFLVKYAFVGVFLNIDFIERQRKGERVH